MKLFQQGLLFLSCFVSCLCISAQNEGKEFWFTCGMKPAVWPYSGVEPADSAIIYILGHHSGSGYVQNPYSSFYFPFDIYPDSLITVSIPAAELFHISDTWNLPLSAIQGATIVIRTTEDVQVWFQSPRFTDYNISYPSLHPSLMLHEYPFKVQLFPVSFYGKQYRIPSYDHSYLYYVIAVSDSTQIFINNDSVLLNAGEMCTVYGLAPISGNIHTNCKKIIVYSGYHFTTSYGSLPDYKLHYGTTFLIRALKNNLFFSKHSIYSTSEWNNNEMIDFVSYPTSNNPICVTYHNNYHHLSDTSLSDSVIYASVLASLPTRAIHNIHYNSSYIAQEAFGYYVNSGNFLYSHPTERMTTHWDYPITKNTFQLSAPPIDTTYIDLTIYVHENGLSTTYLNGQHIPAEAFEPFPWTNGEYYSAQFTWYSCDSLPDYITIDNPNGFTGYVYEIGYSFINVPYFPSNQNPALHVFYFIDNSSPYNYLESPFPHSNLSVVDSDIVHHCLGDTLALLVEHNPDSVPVEWIVDGVSHLGDAYSFLLTALDTLAVQCVLHYDCPDTTTTFVAVVPPPVITVAHDTTVCAGATLSVEQPSALAYLWSNGETTPSITVDSAGTFQVAVTNIGCRAESDSFHVSLYGQSSVDFGNDSILCELATLLLDATQQHPAQYFWQDGSTNTTYTVYQDGDYWVVITDHCLGASDTINIGYLNDFTVSLGPDTILCEGKTLTLSAEVPYCDYLWQDGSTQPTYLVRGPGTYSVEVSNKCFSHWDAVNVDYEHCAQELYLPNAFTPNDDGKNPVFLPIFSYPDEIEEYRMEIYNRWGTLMFRTEEKTFGWDGANAMDGVYAVVVHYKTRGEKAKTVTGNVTVVR